MEKKRIAWGTGTLLKGYLTAHPKDHGIAYIVNTFQKEETEFMGVPFVPMEALQEEELSNVTVVIFSVSNSSRRAIGVTLNSLGLRYGEGYIDSADLFRPDFEKKASAVLGKPLSQENYSLARSHYNNSHVNVQTTVCGNWFMIECLKDTARLKGNIVEVGAYRGGNAVLMLQTLCNFRCPTRSSAPRCPNRDGSLSRANAFRRAR